MHRSAADSWSNAVPHFITDTSSQCLADSTADCVTDVGRTHCDADAFTYSDAVAYSGAVYHCLGATGYSGTRRAQRSGVRLQRGLFH